MATLDLGNQCLWCQNDTSMGSGRFVNRIPATTDTDTISWLTEAQKAQYDYVEGYCCAECGCYECDICGEPIATDTDIADEVELGHYHSWCLPFDQWHRDAQEWFEELPEAQQKLWLTAPSTNTSTECACPTCSESELYSRLFCQNCFDNSCSESEDNC